MGSGQFDKAGILAADFSGLEAASPGFTVSSPVVFSPRAGWGHGPDTVANVIVLSKYSSLRKRSTP
jgi:profilin